jgi:hypothetical protein
MELKTLKRKRTGEKIRLIEIKRPSANDYRLSNASDWESSINIGKPTTIVRKIRFNQPLTY